MRPHGCLQFIEEGDDDIFFEICFVDSGKVYVVVTEAIHCSATSYILLFFNHSSWYNAIWKD